MLSDRSSCGLGEGVSDGLTVRRVIQEGRHRGEVQAQETVSFQLEIEGKQD